MGSSRRRKRKRKGSFEWAITSSVPEDLDKIEEEESEESPTIHSASYKKLRLLSTSSDDSGIAIEIEWIHLQTANLQLVVTNSLLSFLISWGRSTHQGVPASFQKAQNLL